MNDIRVPEVKAIVSVDGERMNFLSLRICQRMSEHHDFEIIIDYKSFDDKFFDAPEKKLALVNTKVVIDLQNGDDICKAYVFSGLVTSVRMLAQGAHGAILLTGKSNTIELERGEICQTYSNTNLYTIINEITEGTINLSVINNPDWESDIAFAIQFKENDWEFLRRICHQYNTSYHYNGLDLIIGPYPEYPVVNLTYDMELSSLEVCSRLLPNESTNYFYRREDHSTIRQDSPQDIDGANYYLQEVGKRADYLTRERKPNTPVEAYVPDMDSLINQMTRKKVATGAEMMYIKGEVKVVDVLIGRLINVKFPKSLGGSEIGTYRVYEVTHQIDQNGRYACSFEAVPADLEYLPTPKVRIPVINPIQVECWSNEDPLGIGRVKVKFPFDERPCDLFIPVMTPDAGGKGAGIGPPSRGFSFIPEISDSLMLSFSDDQLSHPFIIGSMFHGLNADNIGGEKGNHIKVIKDKIGNFLEFNSYAGSIKLVTGHSNNTILLDGEGNIYLQAPNKIVLNADDIEINSKNNIQITANNNIDLSSMKAIYQFAPYFKQIIDGKMQMFSAEALIHSIDKMNIQSEILKTIGTKEIMVHSEDKAIFNSKGTAYVHGQNKTSFTNFAQDEKGDDESPITDVIVEFRSLQADKGNYKKYDGGFGFDWLRIKETATTEEDYETIIDRGYKDGATNYSKSTTPTVYEQLTKEYKSITISGETEPYYIPYLTIYPNSVNGTVKPPSDAFLRLLIRIKKIPEKVEIHFTKTYFQIEDSSDPHVIDSSELKIRAKEEVIKPIKITCIKEFSSIQHINVYAFFQEGKELKRRLAGRLKVLPNDKNTKRKTQKIALIPVKLKAGILGFETESTGSVYSFDKTYVYKAYYQALIYPDIEEPGTFDITSEVHTKAINNLLTGYIIAGKVYQPSANKFCKYLRKAFTSAHPNKYIDYILVFCIKIDDTKGSYGSCDYDVVNGQFVFDKTCLMFDKRSTKSEAEVTLAHESLHGLGLFHTFYDRDKDVDDPVIKTPLKWFYYNGMDKTDNLMSYHYNNMRTTWNWQWKIINEKLK